METLPMVEQRPLTALDIRAQVNLIQEVMKAVMRDKEHYGIIPGCQKPSLWKPGAEKLLVTFRIASEPEILDLSTADEARYRVIRKGTHINSGTFVGAGIGECSSGEEKYKWRKSVCDEEFDVTPETHRREKFSKYDGKVTKVKQVRTNPSDVANTVLKMADKRAYVALALNVTAASDIFTQDIEELPEEMRDHGDQHTPIKGPEVKAAPVVMEGENSVSFIPAAASSKPDKNGKDRWAVKSPDDVWYATYNQELGERVTGAKSSRVMVSIRYTTEGNFHTITGATLA